MIGLVDGNNFFASCEQVFDPRLRGKPVAVLSNNDGCVVSRSYEFKALNIPMGTPYFKLRDVAAARGLVLRSSNYALYADLSRRVMSVLAEFAGDVEQYSIDEAFIRPLTVPEDDYYAFGLKLRRAVLKYVGIPCGIGFAANKTLAKTANHIGKKTESGVFVMPEDPSRILARVPVSEVWGVGRNLLPALKESGINTALELARADDAGLRRKFGVNAQRISLELRGVGCIEREDVYAASKSVSFSRSFGHPVTALKDIEEAVSYYISRAAEKLRAERLSAAGVNVYLLYYPEYGVFQSPAGYVSATIPFDYATDDTAEMLSMTGKKLPSVFLRGRRYKKAGILFFGLEKSDSAQPDLFIKRKKSSDTRFFGVVDELNAKYGGGTVFALAEGIEKGWRMRRDMLSPSYTTDWNGIPSVK